MRNRLVCLVLILCLTTIGCGGSNSGGSGLKTSENLGSKELPLPKSPADSASTPAKGARQPGGGPAAQ